MPIPCKQLDYNFCFKIPKVHLINIFSAQLSLGNILKFFNLVLFYIYFLFIYFILTTFIISCSWMFYRLFLSICYFYNFWLTIIFYNFLIEYIYFIVAVENGGSKSRNVQLWIKDYLNHCRIFLPPCSTFYYYLLISLTIRKILA